MSLLERIVQADAADQTIAALVERYCGHMYWPIRDLVRSDKRLPSRAKLTEAARLLQTAAPSNVGKTAAWFELLDVLAANGLSDAEQLQVLLEVLRGPFKGGAMPGTDVVARVAAVLDSDDANAVRPWVRSLDAEPVRRNPLYTLICAMPLLKAGEPPPAAIDQAYLFSVSPAVVRALLQMLGPAQGQRILLRCMQTDSDNAAQAMLNDLSFLLDMLDTPALQAALDRLRKVAVTYPGIEEIYAQLDAGGAPLDADGLSATARGSLDYWLKFLDAVQKEEPVGPLAEQVTAFRVAVPDADELMSLEAWTAASDDRRQAVARAVLAAIGKKRFELVGIQTFGDLPVAVFQHRRTETRLSLVPGGSYRRGLSEAEERKLTKGAEVAGLTDTYEEYGQLVDHFPAMRPVREVTVGPMLIGQSPGFELEPAGLADWLDRAPWRLPTEAEWEYAARGALAGQLTFRGDALPHEAWFAEVGELGERAANRFGLWGFGLQPEICADAWRPSYTGAPVDGGPVTGDGPRVVRGGAAQIHPWQGCGEWHLLLSAMRTSQEGWDYLVCARPVIGLRPRAKAYRKPAVTSRRKP